MNYKKILLILAIILIIPNIFSQANIFLETASDVKENKFYISKNINKTINFRLDTDYFATYQNFMRAEYDLTVYSNNLNQIDLSLSKKEEYFISKVNSNFFLNIRGLNFIDQKIKLKIKVNIYDVFNNLIDSQHIYLDLVSNNSEYDFIDSPINKVPDYKGYSLSRDKMILLNKFDKDLITIKNHVDYNLLYDIKCFIDKEDLILDLRYINNNEFSLEVFPDSDINNFLSKYYINCYAFNKDDVHKIRTITVNYMEPEEKLEPEIIEEEEIIEKENFLKILLIKLNLIKN